MPHCDLSLYEAVLKANLPAHSTPALENLMLVGNSLHMYQQRLDTDASGIYQCMKLLVPLVQEAMLPAFQPCAQAFNDTAVSSFPREKLAILPR